MADDEVIDYILQNDLTEEMKCELKNRRPTPYIPMTLKEKNQKRIFQISWYHRYKWLTGSIKEKKLYCFYCLLFGGEADWTGEGINTIKNLDSKAQKHQASKVHIRNSELFHMLGKKLRVSQIISESTQESVCRYNEKVTTNRRILSRLIQTVIYLSCQGLPIIGKNNSCDGYYHDLIKFTAQEEQLIRDHLSNTDMKLTTPDVLKLILQSLKEAVNMRIKNEISAAPFVSVQVDETSDISCRNQISVIFRYCADDKIVERFVGFYDILKNKGAKGISEVVVNILKEWSLEEKLISQSYDGALFMSDPPGTIQHSITEHYPRAFCLHSRNHSLHLILLHGSKHLRQVKKFIADLEAFDSFFKKSSQRLTFIAERFLKLPLQSISHWNFHSRGVTTILAHYTDFMNIFEEISESCWFEFDSNSYGCALQLKHCLSDPNFVYLLFLFQEIFYFVDQLANILETHSTRSVITFRKEMKSTIEKIFGLKCEDTINKCIASSQNLNEKLNYTDLNLLSLTYDIIDSQVLHLENKFSDVHQLHFLEVLNENVFLRYMNSDFPEAPFKQLILQYGPYFTHDRLRNELWNVFADQEKHLEPELLLKCLYHNGLHTVYTETTKLIKLALTMPVHKRTEKLSEIKSYLKKCMIDNSISVLEVLTIEKSMLGELSGNVGFIDEVIDIFSSHNPFVKLEYQKV